jgi:hypothetical protein
MSHFRGARSLRRYFEARQGIQSESARGPFLAIALGTWRATPIERQRAVSFHRYGQSVARVQLSSATLTSVRFCNYQ